MKGKYIIIAIIGLFLGLILTTVAMKNGDVYTQYQKECEWAEENYYFKLSIWYNEEKAKDEYNDDLNRAYQKYQVNKHWFAIKKKHKPARTPYRDAWERRFDHILYDDYDTTYIDTMELSQWLAEMSNS